MVLRESCVEVWGVIMSSPIVAWCVGVCLSPTVLQSCRQFNNVQLWRMNSAWIPCAVRIWQFGAQYSHIARNGIPPVFRCA